MKYFFRKIILSTFLSVGFTCLVAAQNSDLNAADSLFLSKKYTEAFKKYETIFASGKASPAMLTKMAFIKEGLGSYSEALYFLNLYYLETSDKAALEKMRELAEEHNLSGYEYSDFKFLLNFVHQHLYRVILALLVIALFLLAYIYSRKRKEEKPITASLLQIFNIAFIAVLINGLIFQKNAIISSDNALLMSGPSAAAEPLEAISKGHRVELLQQGEVWNLIIWQDKPVYIRSKNIKVL